MSQSISLSNDLEDFFSLLQFVNDLIKPYLLTRQPLTRAIGYGVPSIVEPETNPKDEIKPKNPLSPGKCYTNTPANCSVSKLF